MRIAVINRSDEKGGAAVVSSRLAEALRKRGHQVSMLVWEKGGKDPATRLVAGKYRKMVPFLAERLKIFLKNGMDRSTLFKIDTASDGLPLWRHPDVKSADLIFLNWTNQGMLSLKGLGKLLETGKPVIITMHDMWAFTGICHHSGECRHYEGECGDCPLLKNKAGSHDLSFRIWHKKAKAYAKAKGGNLRFVAVSSWLASRARTSGLLKDREVDVIPNTFELKAPDVGTKERDKSADNGEIRILFGAARIDDTVKDHPTLVRMTQILRDRYPEEAKRMKLITFGDLKDPAALSGVGISHEHLGVVPSSRLPELYSEADIVISSSLYETLPGTLVEGQAYGAIPVALDHGGQRDIIDHKLTGYLAEWSDSGEQRASRLAEGVIWASGLKYDQGMKERMRREVKERFGASKVAGRYEDLYSQVVGKLKKKPNFAS